MSTHTKLILSLTIIATLHGAVKLPSKIILLFVSDRSITVSWTFLVLIWSVDSFSFLVTKHYRKFGMGDTYLHSIRKQIVFKMILPSTSLLCLLIVCGFTAIYDQQTMALRMIFSSRNLALFLSTKIYNAIWHENRIRSTVTKRGPKNWSTMASF